MIPWLTILALTPLAGAALLLLPVREAGRWLGFGFSLATLAIAGWVTWLFATDPAAVPAETAEWIPQLGASWSLGLDGMGLAMALLTAALTPAVLLAEWKLPHRGRWSAQAFFALVLLVEGLSLLAFLSMDILVFYLAFEATLIPMYFLIGGFGVGDKAKAALKFLLFGLAGGLIMLVGVIGVGVASTQFAAPTLSITQWVDYSGGEVLWQDPNLSRALMICFLAAFALKAPMVPGHTWLPTAAESATPGSSVLMVGIMDKLGTFGMIRVCLTLFPEESKWASPVMVVLALVSILYGALAAIGSKNLLRLVAYTSISHFGFMVLGIYTFTATGLSGTMFYMVNHGLSTAALFLVIGFLVNRRGSAQIGDFGGVQKVAPVLSGALLLAGLSGLALPGMSSFVSEFQVLSGTWSQLPWAAVVAALGTVLAAVYILLMYQRTMTGPVPEGVAQTVTADLSFKEGAIGFGLAAVILVLGFAPGIALSVTEPAAQSALGATATQLYTPPFAGQEQP
ncbi:MAG: NADH-quinone oxidoreductase subunit M [Propionibacteriaceae bacterium]|jgi:NADH-quinone oxidoreductase subunit M|nr:NADH-quinone oxidoreductase subunit M [Propionibacteriaceae bacterium]